jgi:transposase
VHCRYFYPNCLLARRCQTYPFRHCHIYRQRNTHRAVQITNDYDGFYQLLSKLAPLDQNSIIIGLEPTAHTSANLVRFLISKDFKVCVLTLIKDINYA